MDGKVILAFQDMRFIERIIAAGLPKLARNTITDPEKFRQELEKLKAPMLKASRELSKQLGGLPWTT